MRRRTWPQPGSPHRPKANPHPPTTTPRTHRLHMPLPPADLRIADGAPSRHKVKTSQTAKTLCFFRTTNTPGPQAMRTTDDGRPAQHGPRSPPFSDHKNAARPQDESHGSTQPLTSSDQKPTQTTDRQLPVHSTGHIQVPGTDTEPAATVLQAPKPTAPPACLCTCNVPDRRKRATRPGCAPGHQPPDCMRHDPTGADANSTAGLPVHPNVPGRRQRATGLFVRQAPSPGTGQLVT